MPSVSWSGIGAYINQPIICSGYDGNIRSDKCLKYDTETAQWTEFAKLKLGRFAPAAVVLNSDIIWITGGYNNGYLKTTEFVSSNGEVTVGPELLEGVWGHCMLITPEAEQFVFIIGGFNGDSINTVRKYLITDNDAFYVEDGPGLIHKRSEHGCASFTSANHDGRDIAIVAGGKNSDGSVISIEAWDYRQPGSAWSESKTLVMNY